MTRSSRRVLVAALAVCVAAATPSLVYAQFFSGDWDKELLKDQPGPKTPAEQAVEKQILELQAALKSAAQQHDVAKTRSYFADNYTMTHGAGMVDDADGRARWVADGTHLAFEVMPVEHQTVRVLSPTAAVAILNSRHTMTTAQGTTTVTLRYMIVYAKGTPSQGYQGWRQVAALVNPIPDKR